MYRPESLFGGMCVVAYATIADPPKNRNSGIRIVLTIRFMTFYPFR